MSERLQTATLAAAAIVAIMIQPVHAQEATGEIALSDDSVNLRYAREHVPDAAGSAPGEIGFGLFWTENRDFVATGNYYVTASRLRFDRLTIMGGPVAYAAMLNTENTDVFGLALGAEARFELLRRQGLDLVGRVAYAPDIMTFGSADRIWDVTARAEIPLTDRITGFGGYRLFEVDLLQGTNELEESIHFGLRYEF